MLWGGERAGQRRVGARRLRDKAGRSQCLGGGAAWLLAQKGRASPLPAAFVPKHRHGSPPALRVSLCDTLRGGAAGMRGPPGPPPSAWSRSQLPRLSGDRAAPGRIAEEVERLWGAAGWEQKPQFCPFVLPCPFFGSLHPCCWWERGRMWGDVGVLAGRCWELLGGGHGPTDAERCCSHQVRSLGPRGAPKVGRIKKGGPWLFCLPCPGRRRPWRCHPRPSHIKEIFLLPL